MPLWEEDEAEASTVMALPANVAAVARKEKNIMLRWLWKCCCCCCCFWWWRWSMIGSISGSNENFAVCTDTGLRLDLIWRELLNWLGVWLNYTWWSSCLTLVPFLPSLVVVRPKENLVIIFLWEDGIKWMTDSMFPLLALGVVRMPHSK